MTTHVGRLELTGYAALQLLLAGPAIAVFALEVVGVSFAAVVVGIPLLLLALPAGRWLTDQHRRMAAAVLGSPVPSPYQSTDGASLVERLRIVGRDPMTWRDLGWLLVALPLALLTSLLVVLSLLLVVTGVAWWFGTGPVMVARSRIDRWFLTFGTTERLEQRVEALTETRAQTVDHAAAELRRIERDLHDGAQARLVGLGMTLGIAADLVGEDPEGARRILEEARSSSGAALQDLRAVVQGIHPPVLADRGLQAALAALALDVGTPVEITGSLPERLPAPVESAVYFSVAECLSNVGKHAAAQHAWVQLSIDERSLRVVVGDDGAGGADPQTGTGMRGVARRLAAFDGTMTLSSPTGGPTLVELEVPCASSSPRTTPSSGTA